MGDPGRCECVLTYLHRHQPEGAMHSAAAQSISTACNGICHHELPNALHDSD